MEANKFGWVMTHDELRQMTEWVKVYMIELHGPEEGPEKYRTLPVAEALFLWKTKALKEALN